jgi:hypothetical protein
MITHKIEEYIQGIGSVIFFLPEFLVGVHHVAEKFRFYFISICHFFILTRCMIFISPSSVNRWQKYKKYLECYFSNGGILIIRAGSDKGFFCIMRFYINRQLSYLAFEGSDNFILFLLFMDKPIYCDKDKILSNFITLQ